jgi:hypothetical protein
MHVFRPEAADAGHVFEHGPQKNQQEYRQKENPKYLLPYAEEHARIRQKQMSDSFQDSFPFTS